MNDPLLGPVFFAMLLLSPFLACGPTPAPVEPVPADPAYAAVAPIVAANCALAGCHAVGGRLPEFDTGAKFKASKAKTELTEGAMPPLPRRIDAGDKSKLLKYLGGN